MELKEAKVLVTGGSLGIGYAAAKILIDAGAKVVISGRNESNLKKAAEELNADYIAGDVSVESDVVKMVNFTIEKLGGYNVLINNAAYGYFSPLIDIDTEKSDIQRGFMYEWGVIEGLIGNHALNIWLAATSISDWNYQMCFLHFL